MAFGYKYFKMESHWLNNITKVILVYIIHISITKFLLIKLTTAIFVC